MLVSAVNLVTKMQDPKILVVTNDGKRRIYDSPTEGCQNPNLMMAIDKGSILYIPIRTINYVEIFDGSTEK
jgi:hypothetical protein